MRFFKISDSDMAKGGFPETLFSLEVVVDYVQIDVNTGAEPLVPAVAIRLLDFPTLLIYRTDEGKQDNSSDDDLDFEKENVGILNGHRTLQTCGKYSFKRGKSCLIKMSLNALHVHLTNTPLYVMILDLRRDVPKLVGSFFVSLSKAIDQIKQEVARRGISMPSCQSERNIHIINNLMGERVGHISMGYKILSLGASLIPHIPENRLLKSGSGEPEVHIIEQEKITTIPLEKEKKNKEDPPEPEKSSYSELQSKEDNGSPVLLQWIDIEGKQTEVVVSEQSKDMNQITTTGTQTATRKTKKNRNTQLPERSEFDFAADFSDFCPPPLFFCQSAIDRALNDPEPPYTENDPEAMRVEELCSESDEDEEQLDTEEEQSARLEKKQVKKSDLKNQDRATGGPHVHVPHMTTALGEALRQLPLLNALLVEISMLSHQPQQLPLSIHPGLAGLYRTMEQHSKESANEAKPDSATNAAEITQKLTRQNKTITKLKSVQSSAKQTISAHGNQQKDKMKQQRKLAKPQENSSKPSSPPKRKLLYGLTNTLRLRIQQTNPDMLLQHERREMYRKKQMELMKAKNSKFSKGRGVKLSKRVHGMSDILFRGNHFDENIQTMINSLDMDSPRSINKEHQGFKDVGVGADAVNTHQVQNQGKIQANSPTPPQSISEQGNGRNVQVSVPRVNPESDHSFHDAESEDCNFPLTGITNPGFQSMSLEDDPQNPNNSGLFSSEPRYSDDFIDSPDPVGYSDDFTSPEPNGRYSTNFDSSHEPVRDSPASPRSDSTSDSSNGHYSVRNRKPKAPSPIHFDESDQSLKGTFVIVNNRNKPASGSSSNGNSSPSSLTDTHPKPYSGGSLEKAMVPKIKEVSKTNFSFAEGPVFSGKKNRTVISKEVGSSVEKASHHFTDSEDEERDELTSLGFSNQYHHISELVGSKLPGYTL
ncbi:microtubule-associated protein 10 [Erpetoichthys calabaricus]|uniref:microtubule-associated protein 10 n=1 Tax=Erpetoichthys calabaricus TaxID=27687 RepID=UPI002234C4E3|nr:microtubule-associated protein 10 [Erpetoichthys calabaricus]